MWVMIPYEGKQSPPLGNMATQAIPVAHRALYYVVNTATYYTGNT